MCVLWLEADVLVKANGHLLIRVLYHIIMCPYLKDSAADLLVYLTCNVPFHTVVLCFMAK